MKKHRKLVKYSLIIVLAGFLLLYILFLAPYNFQGKLNTNSLGIGNMKNFKEIPELSEYFRDYNIKKIKYLGSNTYEVSTDKGDFVIITDYSDYSFWRYRIFKYDKELEHFKNPM